MIKFARIPTQPNADVALLALRLIFGFCMAYLYGYSKLNKLLGDEPIEFMNFMGLRDTVSLALVVFAEFFCSILLFFGLFARLATIPLMFTMLVAVFYAHWSDPFSDKEHGLLYLGAYLVIFLMGSGRHSVDAWWSRKKTKP
ncbi:MAG: DoxX family protein [Saprospiraceae bacterium]|nr:DoxX family protein [Saprospiraceae bacterium]MDZ4705230.1 DoxX family protein [Saprospiraceae bacterium]